MRVVASVPLSPDVTPKNVAAHRADAQQRDLHMVDFGLTVCAAVLKTGRFVLGPKNVHHPWPLALNLF